MTTRARPRTTVWKPVWAIVVAALALVVPLLELLGGVRVLADYAAGPSNPDAGVALAVGAVLLAAALLAGVPLAIFLVRGGTVAFVAGLVLVGLSLVAGALLLVSLPVFVQSLPSR